MGCEFGKNNDENVFGSRFNLPIENWDVSSVTDMREMFAYSKFNQPIGGWDVSSVKTMMRMFSVSQFNQPIGDWDVSSVTDMREMFDFSKFNQPIENWDVSSVTEWKMSQMFLHSPLQDIPPHWYSYGPKRQYYE